MGAGKFSAEDSQRHQQNPKRQDEAEQASVITLYILALALRLRGGEEHSILKPRLENNPATRASTPNSFSTSTDMVWLGISWSSARARRARREPSALRADGDEGAP
jgi:hypothetical protein